MTSKGRPKIYNNDDEIKQARRETARRAYFKKNNISIEEYDKHQALIQQKKQVKKIRQWFKSQLKDGNYNKLQEVINIVDSSNN